MMRRAISAAGLIFLATAARADGLLPPWSDPTDVPLPASARSVAVKRADTAISPIPGHPELKRGTTLPGARLPLYGSQRAAGCEGRWLHVGPAAWLCSDLAELSAEAPNDQPTPIASDGLPYRYYFVGRNGASGYGSLERAGDEAPDEELDPGFAVATTEQRSAKGQTWVRTRHGTWISTSELGAARPSGFAGQMVGASGLDFGWALRDKVNVYSAPKSAGKPVRVLGRFEVVPWREEKVVPGGTMVRISEDGVTPAAWVDGRSVAHPTASDPPPEVGGVDERWIDVDLASQTLVAYEGKRPVFATLVSSGRGTSVPPGVPPGGPGDVSTHKGTFRIWVKLLTSTMDNIESPQEDASPAAEGFRYSMEDVPYVQFFDKAVGLHGVFWHGDFGHRRSHGCVNLAPRDAAWLFGFTSPHLPPGFAAILPSRLDPGTVVRVR